MRAKENIWRIIKKPLITEKSEWMRENLNQYCFLVDKAANKIQIKEAVEKIFEVKVAKVRVINYKGKPKRVRFTRGRTPAWKKAIVTLIEGDRIDIM
ncbi:MAG: 50S ribosomal protein L23 [Planctomycetota bacterium]|nr:MAG: 50S ribosomal protein L23 [Planctomycetota bacterium]